MCCVGALAMFNTYAYVYVARDRLSYCRAAKATAVTPNHIHVYRFGTYYVHAHRYVVPCGTAVVCHRLRLECWPPTASRPS